MVEKKKEMSLAVGEKITQRKKSSKENIVGEETGRFHLTTFPGEVF